MQSRGNLINSDSTGRLTSFFMDEVWADRNTNLITGPNAEVRLEPRVMEVLCLLAESAGEVVLREDMLDEHGSDEGITRAISMLRKAYKKVGGDSKFIETIPKRGYRLVVGVAERGKPEPLSIVRSERHDEHIASLAVLPFSDLSEGQDQEYLSDGISEEVMNALAKLRFLRVKGRTSSFSFKGTKATTNDIAKILDVSHILDGSVRKYGERIRISAQLLEVASDKQVWLQTFDSTQDDLFELQDDVARSVELALRDLFRVEKKIDSDVTERISKPTDSDDAYREFLIGRYLMYELSGQRTIPRAIAAYEKAIEADPNFANAWANLAIANYTLPEFSTTDRWREHFEVARSNMEHALSLDPDNAWGHRARALIVSYELKFDEAVDAYHKALSINATDPELIFTSGYILAAIGLHKQARRFMADASALEPLRGAWYSGLGSACLIDNQVDEAEALYRKSFEYNFGFGGLLLAELLAHKGQVDEAITFLEQNYDGLGPVMHALLDSSLIRKIAYAAFFKKSKWARAIMDVVLTRKMKNPKSQPSLGTILGFQLIGRPEKFFQHVLEKPNPYIGFALSRIWEPTDEAKAIRTHPGFPQFAESIGFVRAWQRFGWPDCVKPTPGTDGSNGQFSCE